MKLAKHYLFLLLSIGVALSGLQCDNKRPTKVRTTTGSVELVTVIPPGVVASGELASKAVVARARVQVTGAGMEPVDTTVAVSGGRLSLRLDEIPVGLRTISLDLLEGDGAVLWSASSQVTVVANSTASAVLTLAPQGDAPPVVRFQVGPDGADTRTALTFSAQVTDRHDADQQLQVRWDFNSDGTYEIDWTTEKTIERTVGVAGTYQITVQARDSGDNRQTDTNSITVAQAPAPVAAAGLDQINIGLGRIELNGTASRGGRDGDQLSYTWQQVAGNETVNLENPASARPAFVPTKYGAYDFSLLVNDSHADSEPDQVRVWAILESAVFAPTGRTLAQSIGLEREEIDAAVGETVQVGVWARGMNGVEEGTVVLGLEPPEAFNLVNAFTFLPGFSAQFLSSADLGPDQVGISFTATDSPQSGGGLPAVFSLELLEANGASIYVDRVFFKGQGGATEEYRDESLDLVVDINGGHVPVVNIAPLAHAGTDTLVGIGTTVVLDGTRSEDGNNDPLDFEWQQIDGPAAVELTDGNTATPSFVPSEIGVYRFALRVDDGEAVSGSDEVVVGVAGGNGTSISLGNRFVQALGIEPVDVANIGAGDSVPFLLYASGMRQVEEFLMVLEVDPISGLDGTGTFLPLLEGFEIMPPPELALAENQLVVRVVSTGLPKSGGGLLGIFSFTMASDFVADEGMTLRASQFWVGGGGDVVRETDLGSLLWRINGGYNPVSNTPPVAVVGPIQSGVVGQSFVLDGTQSEDPEGVALNYTWYQTGGPEEVWLRRIESAMPRFTPLQPGSYRFELVVNDGSLSSEPAETAIEVFAAATDLTVHVGGSYVDAIGLLPGQLNGVGPGEELVIALVAQGMDEVELALLGIQVNPPEAFDLGGAFAEAGMEGFIPITPAVNDEGEAVFGIGSAVGPISGDGIPLVFSLPTTAAMSAATEATVEFVALTIGGQADDLQETFTNLAFGVSINGGVISRPNTAPIARIDNDGPDQVQVGDQVQLRGDGSSDLETTDSSQLEYRWQVDGPAPVELFDERTDLPFFFPTEAGVYRIQLVVSDGQLESEPVFLQVTVEPEDIIGPLVPLRLAFSTDKEGYEVIFTSDANGGDAVNLTGNAAFAPAIEPEVNAEGTKIVYTVPNTEVLLSLGFGVIDVAGIFPSGDVWSMNIDGTNRQNLTRGESINGMPTWSANGELIAFSTFRTNSSGNTQFDIWVMNTDGSNSRNLSNRPGVDVQPDWSPEEGGRIAFARSPGVDDEGFALPSDIWSMNVLGGLQRNLTNSAESEDLFPAWSPDGRRIAFTSDRDFAFDIYVMDADGSNIERLTDSEGDDKEPAWSPDGRRIAFVSDRGDDYEIYIMDADGSNMRLMAAGYGNAMSPSWVPDSDIIEIVVVPIGN